MRTKFAVLILSLAILAMSSSAQTGAPTQKAAQASSQQASSQKSAEKMSEKSAKSSSPKSDIDIPYTRFVLDNGLTVIVLTSGGMTGAHLDTLSAIADRFTRQRARDGLTFRMHRHRQSELRRNAHSFKKGRFIHARELRQPRIAQERFETHNAAFRQFRQFA